MGGIEVYIILGILFYFATAFTGVAFIESWKKDEIKLSVVCFVFSIIFAVSTIFCFAKFTEEKVGEEIVKENLNQGGRIMKATELMIGDWVSALRKNCRITSIDKYDAKVCTDPEDELFFLDDIYPIPLTPEILEKNGWYWGLTSEEEDIESCVGVSYGKHWAYDEGAGEISLIFPDDTNGGLLKIDDQRFNRHLEFIWNDTLYVHELQRALRLCGLDELADNFKI